MQTITKPGDGLWELLGIDYIKGLRLLLEYPAHVEHLVESDWTDATTFCLLCLGLSGNEGVQLSIRTSHRSSSEALDAESSRLTPSRSITARNTSSSRSQANKSISDEAVVCVQLLTATPAAPLQDIARELMSELLIYLFQPTATNAHQALKATNNILERVINDQCALVQEFLPDIIPVIRRLWLTKSPAVKDEALVTLLLCMDLLRISAESFPFHTSLQGIEDLLETLETEYLKRPEKEHLQIDDLVFFQSDSCLQHSRLFGPRLGNPRSEHNWTLIWTISSLISILDNSQPPDQSPKVNDDELAPNKRPRLSSRMDDLSRECITSVGLRKGYCLQLLSFLACRMSIEAKASLVSRLAVSIIDDNSFTSNWSLLTISK